MIVRSKADIVRSLFAAYLTNNSKAVENSFTDDFRFTSPYDDRIDKAAIRPAMTFEIIPQILSVPQNPVRLVDERWFATGLLHQNRNGA